MRRTLRARGSHVPPPFLRPPWQRHAGADARQPPVPPRRAPRVGDHETVLRWLVPAATWRGCGRRLRGRAGKYGRRLWRSGCIQRKLVQPGRKNSAQLHPLRPNAPRSSITGENQGHSRARGPHRRPSALSSGAGQATISPVGMPTPTYEGLAAAAGAASTSQSEEEPAATGPAAGGNRQGKNGRAWSPRSLTFLSASGSVVPPRPAIHLTQQRLEVLPRSHPLDRATAFGLVTVGRDGADVDDALALLARNLGPVVGVGGVGQVLVLLVLLLDGVE